VASLGYFAAGFLSQKLQSRKKAIRVFLLMVFSMMGVFLRSRGLSVTQFYWVCAFLGFGMGYWALFVTVTTTVPNFVRSSMILLTLSFQFLRGPLGILNSAGLIGVIAVLIAWISVGGLKESFHQDLDFVES